MWNSNIFTKVVRIIIRGKGKSVWLWQAEIVFFISALASSISELNDTTIVLQADLQFVNETIAGKILSPTDNLYTSHGER